MYDSAMEELKNIGVFSVDDDVFLREAYASHYGMVKYLRNITPKLQNNTSKSLIQILEKVFYLHLDFYDKSEPYHFGDEFLSSFDKDTSRQLFEIFIKNSSSCFVNARVYDVLWVTKKLDRDNSVAAEKAVENYLQCIDKFLSSEQFLSAGDFLRRVFNLVLGLGKQSEKVRKSVFERVEEYLQWDINEKNEPFLRSVWDIDPNIKLEDDENIRRAITGKAENYVKTILGQNTPLVDRYFDLIIKNCRILGDFDKKKENQYQYACHYKELAKAESNPFSKDHFLRKTINILRQINGNPYKEDITNLNQEIKDNQSLYSEYMTVFESDPIDISLDVAESVNSINKADDLYEALIILAHKVPLPSEAYVNEEAKKNPSIIEKIATPKFHDSEGRTKPTPKFSMDEMLLVDSFYQLNTCDITLLPMLKTINQNYFFIWSDFLDLVRQNLFVPDGYEEIFAKGIYNFLIGKYFESASFLIPQIENSLRYIISKNKPTNYVTSEGADFEKIDLDDLIKLCEDEKIIPNNLSFNMRYLLGSKNQNIRNNIAHGLMDYQHFSSYAVIVTLYLVFWFIMFPHLLVYIEQKK